MLVLQYSYADDVFGDERVARCVSPSHQQTLRHDEGEFGPIFAVAVLPSCDQGLGGVLPHAPKIHLVDLDGEPKYWLARAALLPVVVRGLQGAILAQSDGILQLAGKHARQLEPAQAVLDIEVGSWP